jgi:hypothetical protein
MFSPEMRIKLVLFLPLLMLISCTTYEVCDIDTQSELVAGFKTIESGAVTDTIVSGVTVFGIREGQSDSLLYDSITTKQILLPLDPHHDFSRFVLHVNEQTDTLRVIHTTESYLISYTCGFGSLFTLDNVSYSNLMIQNLEIINSVIDAELEQNEEHLWIYF